jgi:hypothetical protein
MEKFANSIPNIPNLVLKQPSELERLCIQKVEWSTNGNALQSVKFFYSDGTESPEFGQRDKSTVKTCEIKPN